MQNYKFGLFLFYIFYSFAFSESVVAQTLYIIGDSLTEGYGVSESDAYPRKLEQLLNKNYPKLRVVSGSISGATTAGATDRVKWFKQDKADEKIFLLALGGNDLLRGIPPESSYKNLKTAILEARSMSSLVVLAGMKVPKNYGTPYRKDFDTIYPKLAKDLSVPFIPFLLEGVGSIPAFNQPDGIHPNAQGHTKIATHVYEALLPLLEKRKQAK